MIKILFTTTPFVIINERSWMGTSELLILTGEVSLVYTIIFLQMEIISITTIIAIRSLLVQKIKQMDMWILERNEMMKILVMEMAVVKKWR